MPIKILLIEDNPADADLLQELLEAAPAGVEWELVAVELRREALQELSQRRFDVVLLDLSLPDSHGLETLAKLRAVAPETAMVVMTGLNDEAIALEAVRLGAQDYLVKGQITSQLLVRAIRYAIERAQTLQLMRESEQRFRAIFDQTFQLMGLLAPDGTILEINQTAIDFTSIQPENIVGSLFWEIQVWSNALETQKQLKDAIAAAARGEFVRFELDAIGAKDSAATLDFSLKPVKSESGKVVMLIAEARDISDRKRAEAEILKALERERELSELRSRFVSMVSHEFRTPLSTILLSSGLLQTYSAKWPEEKKQVHFQRIESAVKRMSGLLDDVLVIGKAEAGKLEFKPVAMELEKFCQELADELQLTVGNRHKLVFTCQSPCTEAKMDEKLLRHVLSNLLSNAFKYSPEGSTVQFELTCDSNFVPPDSLYFGQKPNFLSAEKLAVFRILDEGIGIPKEDQERLFETFHRGTNVGTISGTGLGLAIVKRSVDLHGGNISCHSEVGTGTAFTVTLPLSSSHGR